MCRDVTHLLCVIRGFSALFKFSSVTDTSLNHNNNMPPLDHGLLLGRMGQMSGISPCWSHWTGFSPRKKRRIPGKIRLVHHSVAQRQRLPGVGHHVRVSAARRALRRRATSRAGSCPPLQRPGRRAALRPPGTLSEEWAQARRRRRRTAAGRRGMAGQQAAGHLLEGSNGGLAVSQVVQPLSSAGGSHVLPAPSRPVQCTMLGKSFELLLHLEALA